MADRGIFISRLAGAILLAVLLLQGGGGGEVKADQTAPQVWVMDLRDAIGPAMSDWFTRALDDANQQDAALFVLRLDTPGGLDRSMRDMISAILDSKVPVVTYVAPQGSRAASAGTYILYASHFAAMAPATNLGAATPVEIGGGGSDQPADNKAPSPAVKGDAEPHQRKQVNDAAAYIRGLAELRGRNADWAERAVREAVSLTASEAQREQVVDLIAPDLDTLLRNLDGRRVQIGGAEHTLDLEHYQLHQVEPDWRTTFLAVITNPSIAYILLLVGVYGLILEFSNPGVAVPGILGAISLLLGLYALQMLPISYVGLSLILIGVGLVAAEAFTPSFGALGVGGMIAFVVGSVMLMDTHLPAFRIALPVIAAVGTGSVVAVGVLVRLAITAHRGAQVTGDPQLIGQWAVALEDFQMRDGQAHGQVRLLGEIWQARASGPVRLGERLRVRAREGLILDVEVEP